MHFLHKIESLMLGLLWISMLSNFVASRKEQDLSGSDKKLEAKIKAMVTTKETTNLLSVASAMRSKFAASITKAWHRFHKI
jgi:hypothetical protein